MLDLSKIMLISIIISNISNLTCYIYIYPSLKGGGSQFAKLNNN
jgi:hypothetical protein